MLKAKLLIFFETENDYYTVKCNPSLRLMLIETAVVARVTGRGLEITKSCMHCRECIQLFQVFIEFNACV